MGWGWAGSINGDRVSVWGGRDFSDAGGDGCTTATGRGTANGDNDNFGVTAPKSQFCCDNCKNQSDAQRKRCVCVQLCCVERRSQASAMSPGGGDSERMVCSCRGHLWVSARAQAQQTGKGQTANCRGGSHGDTYVSTVQSSRGDTAGPGTLTRVHRSKHHREDAQHPAGGGSLWSEGQGRTGPPPDLSCCPPVWTETAHALTWCVPGARCCCHHPLCGFVMFLKPS